MPRMTLVRYTTRPECADENEALSRRVYEALRAQPPAHIAYALFRHGADFVHLLVNTRDDSADPVTELPQFKAFTQDIAARTLAPPDVTRINFALVDAFGFPD